MINSSANRTPHDSSAHENRLSLGPQRKAMTNNRLMVTVQPTNKFIGFLQFYVAQLQTHINLFP